MAKRSEISDFDIISELGRGSFGVVYKVRRKQDNKYYVMKRINIGVLSAEEQQESLNEVHILAALNHKHVVRYYDSFMHGSDLHIIMELCTNGDLNQKLRSSKGVYISEKEIWKYFIQTCLGVHHLHTKKILHRDLKTMNLFLDENNNIKIGDLGVAKVLGSAKFANTIVGTPYYLSPELCEDKPYDSKSDVWALGCVLYELCTLRHPFDARNQGALILKIIQGNYPPLPVGRYTRQLSGVLDRCLQKNTRRRPDVAHILTYTAVYNKAVELGLDVEYPNELKQIGARRLRLSKVDKNNNNNNMGGLLRSVSTPDNRLKDNRRNINRRSNKRIPKSIAQQQVTRNNGRRVRSNNNNNNNNKPLVKPRVRSKTESTTQKKDRIIKAPTNLGVPSKSGLPRSVSQPVNINNNNNNNNVKNRTKKTTRVTHGLIKVNKLSSLDNIPSYHENTLTSNKTPPRSKSPAQYSPTFAAVKENEAHTNDDENNDEYNDDEVSDYSDDDNDNNDATKVGWRVFKSVDNMNQDVLDAPSPGLENDSDSTSNISDDNVDSVEQQLRNRASRLRKSILDTKAACLQTMSLQDFEQLLNGIMNGSDQVQKPQDMELMGRIYKIVYCQGELDKVTNQIDKLVR